MKILILCVVVLPAGCASASHADRAALLNAPIDCMTAETDLAALEAAEPSGGERARSILQSVTPVGLVTGAVSGSYRDRAAVATGKTQNDIEDRIAEIKKSCDGAGSVNQPIHED